MSTPQKVPLQLLVLLAGVSAIGPLNVNIYLPSLPVVQAEFAVTLAQTQATVSAAMLAFGIGLLVFGPLSDHFGRRQVVLWGLVIFTLGALAGVLAPTLGALTFARIVQAAGASVAFVVARAVLADLSSRESLGRVVAQMTMIMLIAQMAGPLIGSIAMNIAGWRAIQALQLGIGIVLVAATWWRLPETRPVWKAGGAPDGKPDAATNRMPDARPDAAVVTRPPLSPRLLFGPAAALLKRPLFDLRLTSISLLYATFPIFTAAAPHLIVDAFGRPASDYGLYFPLLPIGYFMGNWVVLHRGRSLGARTLVFSGGLVGLGAALLGLACFALGAWHPLALFVPAGLLLNLGMGLALPTLSAQAIEEARPHTGSGWSLVGFSQQLFSAVGVQLTAGFATHSPVPLLWLFTGMCAAVLIIEARQRPR